MVLNSMLRRLMPDFKEGQCSSVFRGVQFLAGSITVAREIR
ncbi:hypothetical protein A2U01_0025275 [Trifolium medium]|uniref:Uncharacterized protein n=1 Tax=Trifolium medium TaxID=97028 RepID=A0A392NY92_9FABA|nr:hypothetical protein [Trifolium medium]